MVVIHHISPENLERLLEMHQHPVTGEVPTWLEVLFESSPHFKEISDDPQR